MQERLNGTGFVAVVVALVAIMLALGGRITLFEAVAVLAICSLKLP